MFAKMFSLVLIYLCMLILSCVMHKVSKYCLMCKWQVHLHYSSTETGVQNAEKRKLIIAKLIIY